MRADNIRTAFNNRVLKMTVIQICILFITVLVGVPLMIIIGFNIDLAHAVVYLLGGCANVILLGKLILIKK